jgi:hypothetical protein
MGIIGKGSDGMSRKERKEMKANQIKRLKEIRVKASINRSLLDLKNQSKKLGEFKTNYIEKAREALRTNNQETYSLAKSGIKLALTKQKFLDSMVANFEIAMQLNDMNEVIHSFVKGIQLITNKFRTITTSIDLLKAQESFENAVFKSANQYEVLNNFLTIASDGLKSIDFSNQPINEDEIDNLITNQTLDVESQLDTEIKKKLEQIKDKIEAK